MNGSRRLIEKRDIAVILILCLAVGLCFFLFGRVNSQKTPVAVITVNGEEIKRINLARAEDGKITLSNGVVIETVNHAIRFTESGCRDKICIHTGSLDKVGDTAACVPMKTVITLEGADSDIDILTY
ncbi:MAG: NusG domain II-containing protein [Ruminococcaceae bacterium]|nr:NusG domain II-containing protein [Oscillospiraceae bacterium]